MRSSSSAAEMITATRRITERPGGPAGLGRARHGAAGHTAPGPRHDARDLHRMPAAPARGHGRPAGWSAPRRQQPRPAPAAPSLTRRVSGVHGRRRAVQHSLRCVQSRVDDADVQVREVTGPPSGRAQQGGLQTASAPMPARGHAHPSPGEAGPGQVPAGRADRLGRGAVEPDRYAGDRTQAPGYPAAGRLSGHGRMPQADAEKLTVIARVRGHKGGVEVACQRTPWLDAGEDERPSCSPASSRCPGASAAKTPQVPACAATPASARIARASLCASRTRATVRFCSATALSTAQRLAVCPQPGCGSCMP